MSDPQTFNTGLAVPTRGSDVGTWDTPVNGDFTAIDGYFGGVQSISLSSSPVTLTSPAAFTPTPSGGPTQAQNAVIRLTGALSNSVTVTLPLPGYYIVENLTTTVNLAFIVTLRALGSGEIIGLEQGIVQHVYNDGTNIRFVNLPPVGTYLDVCDATVPAWITACTKIPYLNCDGSAFSSGTYPYLANKLGGTTLPDFRGRSPYYLNGGTGRLTSGGAGIDGNTRFAGGGANGINLIAGQIPTLTSSGSMNSPSANVLTSNQTTQGFSTGTGGASSWLAFSTGSVQQIGTLTVSGSVTTVGTGTTNIQNSPPGIVSGIRLIRAG